MRWLDPFTPWREPPAVLAARTVGRDRERQVVEDAVGRLVAGGDPLHLLFVGPRGCGKSHLLALAEQAATAAGLACHRLREDEPAQATADRWIARLVGDPGGGLPPGPAVLVVDGLHRHLEAMGRVERRRLRAALDARTDLLLIASATAPDPYVTDPTEPLYGAVDLWRLGTLGPEAAGRLVDAVASDAARHRSSWPARRATVLTLAGGNPRALTVLGRALSEAVAGEEEVPVADTLERALGDFTAHFQLRFFDLDPRSQAIVEHLARAPGPVGSTAIAAAIGYDAAGTSRALNHLADDGTLTRREHGRHVYYGLAEALFRYWFEYRSGDWERTRVGWLSRLLEQVATDPELFDLAAASDDDAQVAAALTALGRRAPAAVAEVVARLEDPALRDATVALLGRLEPEALVGLARRLPADARPPLTALARDRGLGPLVAAWGFADRLEAGQAPRQAFRVFLGELGDRAVGAAWGSALSVVEAALHETDGRGGPWVLEARERAIVARSPMLRTHWARRGKTREDPPLVAPADLVTGGLYGLEVDGWRVVAAAYAWRDPGLLGAALAAGRHQPAAPVLVPCPDEGWVPGDHADGLVEALLRDGVVRGGALLSWCGALVAASEPLADALIGEIGRGSWVAARSGAVALAAVLRERPDRFERVARVVGDRRPDLVARARDVASWPEAVYPELEAVLRPVRASVEG